jgi:Cu-processing system ATP-binding protein
MTATVSTPPAVEFRGLRKRFGRVTALDAVDIQVSPGRITALVGPNGAGKSTLIKCLLGLVRPDEGSIALAGRTLDGGWAYRRDLGYMPQAPSFPDNLTGREVIAMLRDLRGRSAATDEELLEWFGDSGALDRPVRVLSGGTRQRLNAAIAFLFRPSLIILDEPTAGLDPVASGILKDKIRRVRDGGATVVLSSHLMAELEELAEDLVFLVDGKVRYAGSIEGLKEEAGETGLERAMAAMLRGRSA